MNISRNRRHMITTPFNYFEKFLPWPVVQVNNNKSLTFKNAIERNGAPTNVETVNYLERVVHVLPERCRNGRTFITDSVTSFCNQ